MGRSIQDGRCESWWTRWRATSSSAFLLVSGVEIAIRNELLVTWTRSLWPARNTLLVDHQIDLDAPAGVRAVSDAHDVVAEVERAPVGVTSHSRATQSVDGAELSACSATRTRPVTSSSSRKTQT
jgi:hypothetical protein